MTKTRFIKNSKIFQLDNTTKKKKRTKRKRN